MKILHALYRNAGRSAESILYQQSDEKWQEEVVDYQVENALLKRALGYQYDEITYEDGEKIKRVTKQVAPDTTAQIFWLKNRRPSKWKDKQEESNSDELTKVELLLNKIKEEASK